MDLQRAEDRLIWTGATDAYDLVSGCVCPDTPHTNALHDLARWDVPGMLDALVAVTELGKAPCERSFFAPNCAAANAGDDACWPCRIRIALSAAGPLNPECKAGKHPNCDTVADLVDDTQEEIVCVCACHYEPEQ